MCCQNVGGFSVRAVEEFAEGLVLPDGSRCEPAELEARLGLELGLGLGWGVCTELSLPGLTLRY